MKAKMTVPYQNGCWSAVGYCLVVAFLGPLTIALVVKAQQYAGALICILLAIIMLRGAWKRFRYGMRINEKHIVLLSHRERKVVPYDAVREVVVTFTQDNVAAYIKTEDEEIRFVWDDMWVDSRKTFPSLGWGYNNPTIRIGVCMTDRFVAKSIACLSQCEKVRIENLYSSDL